ncbi:MAG: sensor histidine kinase [Planctomycetaceae bacterium]
MKNRTPFEVQTIQPLRLFLLVLGVLFVIEAIVMFGLPLLVPAESSVAYGAVVDACLLTAILAPMLWYLIVKPLQETASLRQKMLAFAFSAQEAERRRIARDLHDSLGQSLTSLLVGLRTIEESSLDQKVIEQVQELRRIGADTHDEVRRLARGLRPSLLDDLGLLPALERYLDEIAATHHIQTELIQNCKSTVRLPDEVETAAYRIVQEAMTNSIRHGAAARIQVELQCSPRNLMIKICDDGKGFDVASALKSGNSSSPFGLLSLQERAYLLGGEAKITSHPSAGTVVQVNIPLAPQEVVNG